MISGGYIWGRLRLAFTKIADRFNYSCLVMCMYCAIFLSKFFYVLFDTFHLNKKTITHVHSKQDTTTTTFFNDIFHSQQKIPERDKHTFHQYIFKKFHHIDEATALKTIKIKF